MLRAFSLAGIGAFVASWRVLLEEMAIGKNYRRELQNVWALRRTHFSRMHDSLLWLSVVACCLLFRVAVPNSRETKWGQGSGRLLFRCRYRHKKIPLYPLNGGSTSACLQAYSDAACM